MTLNHILIIVPQELAHFQYAVTLNSLFSISKIDDLVCSVVTGQQRPGKCHFSNCGYLKLE